MKTIEEQIELLLIERDAVREQLRPLLARQSKLKQRLEVLHAKRTHQHNKARRAAQRQRAIKPVTIDLSAGPMHWDADAGVWR